MHEKRVEIRWRDIDAYQHVNNAVYATYVEAARDETLDAILGAVGADPWDFVLARIALDFRNEVRSEDKAVLVRVAVARVGTASVTLREEVLKLDGSLAAECESVIVARNREQGDSRPLTDLERAAFEQARER